MGWERQIDIGQRQGEEKKKGIMKWSRLFLNPGNLSRHGLHMGGLGSLLLKESHCGQEKEKREQRMTEKEEEKSKKKKKKKL